MSKKTAGWLLVATGLILWASVKLDLINGNPWIIGGIVALGCWGGLIVIGDAEIEGKGEQKERE